MRKQLTTNDQQPARHSSDRATAGLTTTKSLVFGLLSMILLSASLNAKQPIEIKHLGLVNPDILCVVIKDGYAEYGPQVKFVKQAGDEVRVEDRSRNVYRKGEYIGSLAGAKGEVIKLGDKLVKGELDIKKATRPGSFKISSSGDAAYGSGLSPVKIHRKSKPANLIRSGRWDMVGPVEHTLYLVLPKPLRPSVSYRITGPRGFGTQELRFLPGRSRSEAVHVSQVGFRPDDPAKVAFLSTWMGDGGGVQYRCTGQRARPLKFRVLETKSGRAVYEGELKLSKAGADKTEDAYDRNYSGTDVYLMDFSALSTPGVYRVSVEGIGCSFDFPIAWDAWGNAFWVSARGLYHQRSGIELGPPYTKFKRPRPMHPDDGVKIYHSKCTLMDSGNGLNARGTDKDNFGNLVKGKTDEIVANAWGAYMDAGDWDRRIQHLECSRVLLDLYELFPSYYSRLNLKIPESRNELPDVIDEALFNLDCYRRMQTKEGGIRGGIESAEHPNTGEGSWQESLDIMAYAPGIWSSHVYAGVAARAAHVLVALDPGLAAVYKKSALRAMEWAERELAASKRKFPHKVRDDRNLAAAELFRLTGEKRWHDIFLATTLIGEVEELFKWQSHEQREAPWVYARTQQAGVDAALKEKCRAAIKKEADDRAASCKRTGFRWAKYAWMPPAWSAFSSPDAVSLLRAHRMTAEPRYLEAIVLSCQAGVGANPLNLCYTSGLGSRYPENVLHCDARLMGIAAPPGITVGGPLWFGAEIENGSWWLKINEPYLHPKPKHWPAMESYLDVWWYAPMCEFTVDSTMARTAYVWGYLAARPR